MIRNRSRCVMFLVVFVVMILISAIGQESSMEFIPAIPREFRAVWVATVANIDFPSRKDLSTDGQKKELIAILDKSVDLNLNAIIFQVRPMCDALYKSNLEPWSAFLTGQMGKAPDPFYDPLEFLIIEGHKRGLEIHVWFNPYRAHHPSDKSPIAANHISKTNPDATKKYGSYLWLDPGEKSVQDHSINVIMDVVKRYDVDGVHIDDYFYPYPEAGVDFPDDASWNKYRQSGGTLSRNDWRRSNVNTFVERFYKSVKAEKAWVKMGISPFGIWRPGYPTGVRGLDQYESLYADAKLWLEKGWVDYFTPQLYWPINSPGQPYKDLLKWWVEQNAFKRHIWPGNFTSKIADGGRTPWEATEIVNQITATREQPGASGNVHFSMKAFLDNRDGINQKLRETVYANQALVPASPWLDNKPPARPTLTSLPDRNGNTTITAKPAPGKAAWLYVYFGKSAGTWSYKLFPAPVGQPLSLKFSKQNEPEIIAISVVDRTGNQSDYAMVQIK